VKIFLFKSETCSQCNQLKIWIDLNMSHLKIIIYDLNKNTDKFEENKISTIPTIVTNYFPPRKKYSLPEVVRKESQGFVDCRDFLLEISEPSWLI
jgi:myosin-crossreactive antigen